MNIDNLERGMLVHRPAGLWFWDKHGDFYLHITLSDNKFTQRETAQSSGRIIGFDKKETAIIDFGEKEYWLANIKADLKDELGYIILTAPCSRDVYGNMRNEYSDLYYEYQGIRNRNYDEKRYNEGTERARLLQMIDELSEENHKLRLEKIGISE